MLFDHHLIIITIWELSPFEITKFPLTFKIEELFRLQLYYIWNHVRTRRIRHRTTLKLNFSTAWKRLKVASFNKKIFDFKNQIAWVWTTVEWKRGRDPITVRRQVKRSLWLLVCCRWTWCPFWFLFFFRFFSISWNKLRFISLIFESSAICGEYFFTIGQVKNNYFVCKMLVVIFISLFLNF